MAGDYSAVGASASAPKAKTGLDGDEEFDGRVTITRSENDGWILAAGYRKVQKMRKNENCYPGYCPDKQFTFETMAEASKKIEELFASIA